MTKWTDPAAWRGAWWAYRALRAARRQLRAHGVNGLVVAPPPRVSAAAGRGVDAVLRRVPVTCLERAVVLQAWRTALGDRREIVIGVRPGENFIAHAWLEGEADPVAAQFLELIRLPPAQAPS
jgi:Transglutaminase-like superfamily